MNRLLPIGVCALLCALVLASPVAAQPARPTVAVDISTLPAPLLEQVDALALETRVVQRLLQEGFAVVAPFAQPDVVLALSGDDVRLLLVARGGGEPETVEISLVSATLAELHLEVSQRLVDLARAQIATLPMPGSEPPAERGVITPLQPRASPVPVEPVEPVEEPPTEVHLDVGVGAATLWRGAEVAPMAQVLVGVGDRWSLRLAAAFSRSKVPGLEVFDWHLQAGPAYRLWQAGRLSARAGLLVGVAYHDWWVDPAAPQLVDGGPRKLDPLVSAELALIWRIVGPLELGLRIAPGFTGHRQEHHAQNGALVWGGEAARLESGLSLAGAF